MDIAKENYENRLLSAETLFNQKESELCGLIQGRDTEIENIKTFVSIIHK